MAKYEVIAGSGPVRVTTTRDVKRAQVQRDIILSPPALLEGTRMSLWNSILPAVYSQMDVSPGIYGNADLAARVWVTNRCQHLNASQISAMPLKWNGSDGTDEPAWIRSPDPNQFPNGIGDAMYCITDQLYGWGWSIQYVLDFYADGWPRRWMVIPSSSCEPRFDEQGRKVYRLNESDTFLDPARVIQIDRNPTTRAHGDSAVKAYAQVLYGLLAAQNQATTVTTGGTPKFYLKSSRKLTSDQADSLSSQWVAKTEARMSTGAPPILPPEIEAKEMSFNPADLALLENQEWNARVAATAYGIPSVILNMALQGGLTYQNPLSLMQMWWLTELRTTAKRIVDAFSEQMLPRGQWVSVDASDITMELTEGSDEDDPQAGVGSQGTPGPGSQPRPLTAIGGGG